MKIEMIIEKFPELIRVICILLVCIVANVVLQRICKTKMKKRNNLNGIFLVEALSALSWIIVIIAICKTFPYLSELAEGLIVSSGLVAIVIGLAAQESLANVIAGIFITIFKPFNIGDRVHLAGDDISGNIKSINLRHTIINSYTGIDIIVPNSIIGTSKIENSSYTVGAAYPIELDVAYECKEKRYRAMEIMEDVVSSHPMFFDRRNEEQKELGEKPVTALCTAFNASGIHLKILVWTKEFKDNALTCSECRMKILDKFQEEGIEIPYNKLTIVH